VLADLMTVEEKLHRLKGLNVAWCGDGDNNVLTSWMQAAGVFGFTLTIACPPVLAPNPETLALCQKRAKIIVTDNPAEALKNANVVLTDTWVSMHNDDAEKRISLLKPFQIDSAKLALADKQAVFLHCLPAHRGEEVTDDGIDGARSAVFDAAENRLHVQKSLLIWCFGGFLG
jgi:ornithine carbamoyltransferase